MADRGGFYTECHGTTCMNDATRIPDGLPACDRQSGNHPIMVSPPAHWRIGRSGARRRFPSWPPPHVSDCHERSFSARFSDYAADWLPISWKPIGHYARRGTVADEFGFGFPGWHAEVIDAVTVRSDPAIRSAVGSVDHDLQAILFDSPEIHGHMGDVRDFHIVRLLAGSPKQKISGPQTRQTRIIRSGGFTRNEVELPVIVKPRILPGLWPPA